MKRPYGIEKGEWAYSYIVPCVLAEEYMDGPIVDYKFHCCEGAIRWVQVISERSSGRPRESILDEHYASLPLHMDHKMVHIGQAPPQPATWELMKTLARTLSKPFRYVRVDLYEYGDRVIFGELTFWPLSGCYKTQDESVFGSMLRFDTTFRRPAIHTSVGDLRIAHRRAVQARVMRSGRTILGARRSVNLLLRLLGK